MNVSQSNNSNSSDNVSCFESHCMWDQSGIIIANTLHMYTMYVIMNIMVPRSLVNNLFVKLLELQNLL